MGVVKIYAQRTWSRCSAVLPASKIAVHGKQPLQKTVTKGLAVQANMRELVYSAICYWDLLWLLNHLLPSAYLRFSAGVFGNEGLLVSLSWLGVRARITNWHFLSQSDWKRDTRRQMCQALVVESLGWRKKRLNLIWVLVLKKTGNRSKSWKPPACCFAGTEKGKSKQQLIETAEQRSYKVKIAASCQLICQCWAWVRNQHEALGEAESGMLCGEGEAAAGVILLWAMSRSSQRRRGLGAGFLHSVTILERQLKSHFITTSNWIFVWLGPFYHWDIHSYFMHFLRRDTCRFLKWPLEHSLPTPRNRDVIHHCPATATETHHF